MPEQPSEDPRTKIQSLTGQSRQVGEALLGLPSAERRRVIRAASRGQDLQIAESAHQIVSTSLWHGDIPPPDAMERFERITPGFTDRMLTLVENQQAHRITIESTVVTNQLNQSGRGQLFALTIGIGSLVAAAFCVHQDSDIVAGAIATLGLGTLAVTFITGKRSEQKSRTEKAKNVRPPTSGQVPNS